MRIGFRGDNSLQKTIGKSVIDTGYASVTQRLLFRTLEYQLL